MNVLLTIQNYMGDAFSIIIIVGLALLLVALGILSAYWIISSMKHNKKLRLYFSIAFGFHSVLVILFLIPYEKIYSDFGKSNLELIILLVLMGITVLTGLIFYLLKNERQRLYIPLAIIPHLILIILFLGQDVHDNSKQRGSDKTSGSDQITHIPFGEGQDRGYQNEKPGIHIVKFVIYPDQPEDNDSGPMQSKLAEESQIEEYHGKEAFNRKRRSANPKKRGVKKRNIPKERYRRKVFVGRKKAVPFTDRDGDSGRRKTILDRVLLGSGKAKELDERIALGTGRNKRKLNGNSQAPEDRIPNSKAKPNNDRDNISRPRESKDLTGHEVEYPSPSDKEFRKNGERNQSDKKVPKKTKDPKTQLSNRSKGAEINLKMPADPKMKPKYERPPKITQKPEPQKKKKPEPLKPKPLKPKDDKYISDAEKVRIKLAENRKNAIVKKGWEKELNKRGKALFTEKPFTITMGFEEKKMTGLTVKGFDNYRHKKYLRKVLNKIGKTWFFRYAPVNAIGNRTMKPAGKVTMAFNLYNRTFRFIRRTKSSSQNNAVRNAFRRKLRGISRPPKGISYKQMKMTFKIHKPRQTKSGRYIVRGTVYITGVVRY